MALWTDLIDPAELTGYARQALSDYEAQKGTLARWLPNREVSDIDVKFVAGSAGLVPEARYRSFDSEPEMGARRPGKRLTIELVSLSQQGVIGEREQLKLRTASDEVRKNILFDAAASAVKAIADRSERQRGQVLTTGKATIAQDNYADEADYQRRGDFTATAASLWSDLTADRIGYLETLVDLYVQENGVEPGVILAGRRVRRSLSSGEQFGIQLVGGGTRPATWSDVQSILAGAGLPPVESYDRRTSGGLVVPDDSIILLPAPVDPNDGEGTELGATFWGQTLASSEPEYGIAESEQPGVVAAAFTNDGIPPIKHVFADSLSLPVLANANLSLKAKVL